MAKGLFKKINIEWSGKNLHTHTLDYWGLPFRHSKCKAMGHLQIKCPLVSSGSDCEDSSKDIRVWSLDKSSDMDIEPSGEQGSEAQTPTNSLDAYTITSILVGKL